MDIRSAIRPILAGLVGLGVVALFIIVFVKLLTGHGAAPVKQIDISQYSGTSAVASLLIDSPTVIDQDHYQLQINVSATRNEIKVINGYQNTVVSDNTYPSNSPAFATFLLSIKMLNFAKGTTSTLDYRGYCPTGDRYLYSFNDGQSDLFKFWSTSCGRVGTFLGSPQPVRQLFERQIPADDLDKIIGPYNFTL
jgi:hypothetical protein